MPKSRLTNRQQAVYEFLVATGGRASIREIAAEFGIASPAGVVCHLKALEQKGLIRRPPRLARSIEVLEAAKPLERREPDRHEAGRACLDPGDPRRGVSLHMRGTEAPRSGTRRLPTMGPKTPGVRMRSGSRPSPQSTEAKGKARCETV